MIGKSISHYKIIEKIGAGGMGEVYLAKDTKLNRLVAIKFLPEHLTKDKNIVERFEREAEAAASLNHPNIVTIHDVIESDDPARAGRQLCIVMEYVDGDSLRIKINKDASDLDEVLGIAKQICEGLAEAHNADIVHRDIKPENILIDRRGRVKILDFGLAKLKGVTKLTKETSTMGTVHYMSPEQIQGNDVDHRSDIWSLGVVLHELLTGEAPFKGDYESAVHYAILNENPESIQKIRADVSSELLHVLNRSLEKNPDDRYQSVSEILIDLKRIKRDSDQVSGIDIPVRKSKKFEKISLKKLGIYSGTLIALIIAIIWIFDRTTSEESLQSTIVDERSVAVMYFDNVTGDESLDYWREALSKLMIADLSQSKYLKILSDDRLFEILSRLDQLDAVGYSTSIIQTVATQAKVKYVVTGNFIKAGDMFRLNITLHNLNSPGEDRTYTFKGTGIESMYTMVDSSSKRLKTYLNLSAQEVTNDFDKSVADITTKSPEAYVFYNKGREYKAKRDSERAISNLEEAIKIDTTFAMAYKTLADIYYEKNINSLSEKYTRKVVEFKNRLPDRELYLIQGDFYRSQGDFDKAIGAYEYVIQIFPEDYDAHMNLGELYSDLHNMDEAIEQFGVCVRNAPDNFEAVHWLCDSYRIKGFYDKMKELIKEYQHNYGDRDGFHELLSVMYKTKREFNLALKEIEIAESLNPDNFETVLEKGRIYFAMGNYTDAEKTFEKVLRWEFPGAQIWARAGLADLYLSQGRIEKMKEQAKEGIVLSEELGDSWNVGFIGLLAFGYTLTKDYGQALILIDKLSETAFALGRRAFIFIKMKSLKKARIEAGKFKELARYKGQKRFYNHLVGDIELESGNYKKAIEYFKVGLNIDVPEWQKSPISYSLGLAYHKTGDFRKAEEEYKKIIIDPHFFRFFLGGYSVTKSYYMLGKIYQEQGLKKEAIEYYSKFLEIWKNADEGLPELIDVKEQLNTLKEIATK
jgi:serine/threonine protein kinase/cytochrome c-type biogenesis protein CcmH/NrfG